MGFAKVLGRPKTEATAMSATENFISRWVDRCLECCCSLERRDWLRSGAFQRMQEHLYTRSCDCEATVRSAMKPPQ